jgi:hypothetical protein
MFIIYIIAAAVAVIIIIFIIVVIVFICCCCCKRSSGEKHYDLKKEVNNKKSSKSGLWQDEGGSAFQPNVAYSPTDYTVSYSLYHYVVFVRLDNDGDLEWYQVLLAAPSL